jgi:phage terminase large subunit-like protein
MAAKTLAQMKIDARNNGWPWKIDSPADERALTEGCYLDFSAAERVRRFYAKCLILPKPGGGNQPFRLLDWWYRDVIAPLFGWKRPDGLRRFRKAFITTAKKSAKSTTLSGLACYMMAFDGEEEAEVYTAATDRDQASIMYKKAARCVKLSPHLSRILHCVDSRKRIICEKTGSWYEAISSDADSSEGLNPHCLMVDELHAWRDRDFFNALMYGHIARQQPLFLQITTAGDNDDSVGYEEYQYAKELLSGEIYSQSHFAFIAEAGETREWDDPAGWLEAQPSLRGEVDTERPRDDLDAPAKPVTIGSVETLQELCNEAKESPLKQREFRRYICNRWQVDAENAWLSMDHWDQCVQESVPHVGLQCVGGLDLSAKEDISALCLAFPCEPDVIDLEWMFWTPHESVARHEREWRVPLRQWIDDGWIVATPGESIEYPLIRKAISGTVFDAQGQRIPKPDDAAVVVRYDLRQLGFDPWNATELCEKNLFNEDGVPCIAFRQGYGSMNEPAKGFATAVINHKINHGNNPVARWMAKNVVVDIDPAGNIKPTKKKSRSKIDGIVAAIMAVGLFTLHGPDLWRAQGNLLVT